MRWQSNQLGNNRIRPSFDRRAVGLRVELGKLFGQLGCQSEVAKMLAAMGFIARAKLRQGGELRPMRIEIVDTGADIGRKLVRLCARPVYRRGTVSSAT